MKTPHNAWPETSISARVMSCISKKLPDTWDETSLVLGTFFFASLFPYLPSIPSIIDGGSKFADNITLGLLITSIMSRLNGVIPDPSFYNSLAGRSR